MRDGQWNSAFTIVMLWLLTAVLIHSLLCTPHLLTALHDVDGDTWMKVLGLWLCLVGAVETTRRRFRFRATTKVA